MAGSKDSSNQGLLVGLLGEGCGHRRLEKQSRQSSFLLLVADIRDMGVAWLEGGKVQKAVARWLSSKEKKVNFTMKMGA